MDPDSYTGDFLVEVGNVAVKFLDQKREIDRVVDILFRSWKNRRWVFLLGNGGSASTATHFASDLAKTVSDDPEHYGLKAIALVDNVPLVSATINDWGWENLYITQLRNYWMPRSVVIGISVHGGSGRDKSGAWSQNLLRALEWARHEGGTTIGLSGFDGGPMKDLTHHCLIVPANSTPLVESFHVVLHHLITFKLKERISSHHANQ